jgi:hypothetical protein
MRDYRSMIERANKIFTGIRREGIMRLVLFLVLIVGFSVPAYAEPTQVVGHIKMIRTGWNVESFAIVMDVPTPPGNQPPCGPGPGGGYITDNTQPGYKTYYAAALVAFMENVQIVAIIDGCSMGYPKLIGINLQR